MSKTVSARIPTLLHEELRERCNLIGESINDFIVACIEIGLHNSSDFNFGDELVDETEEKQLN
jgi:predicted DNA-binding protein